MTLSASDVAEIVRGLEQPPRSIASKFFYDDAGSRLFQKIMALPEYYPTRCELDIFRSQSDVILAECSGEDEALDIIELGPGDGLKSAELLEATMRSRRQVSYLPVDISSLALEELKKRIQQRMPALPVEPKVGDYFDVLDALSLSESRKKLILFLGSNIGNYTDEEAADFLARLYRDMAPGDLLLTGFDLAKAAEIILPAYDDSQGVTAAFNYNLLHRLNRECNADFNPEQFIHVAEYDEETQEARSYLESTTEQNVSLGDPQIRFTLKCGERIHTEISRKYTIDDIERQARRAGFRVHRHFFDSRRYFSCSLWVKVDS